MSEQQNFEKAGVVILAPSGRSIRLEIHDPDRVFMDMYYVSIADLEKVLNKKQQTATVVKIKNRDW